MNLHKYQRTTDKAYEYIYEWLYVLTSADIRNLTVVIYVILRNSQRIIFPSTIYQHISFSYKNFERKGRIQRKKKKRGRERRRDRVKLEMRHSACWPAIGARDNARKAS